MIPQIEGTVAIRASTGPFLQAFRQRVAGGLLTGRPHPRANYQVAEAGPDRLRVRAATFWTAINVGLNDVEVRLPQSGSVQFHVRYWRWAGYALGLSTVLGLIGIVLLLTLDVRGYVASHLTAQLPGLTIDQNVFLAWAFVIFWGFVWPWLLIAGHKRPLRRLMERIIREVDAQASGISSAG